MKIAIVGHGYVGKGMERLFRNRFELGIVDTVTQPDRGAAKGADLAVVCVPTPQGPDGAADTSAVEEVVRWLDAPLILIKSTVPPGTTDRLAKETGKAVHFSPEYMGEPTWFVPPWKYPDPRAPETHDFVIVGGPKADFVLDFFVKVMAPNTRYMACTAIEAELAKYMENSWFAMKVTFCNEFARIAETFGIEYKKLRELWLLDSRMDPDHTIVFRDAPGFGGKCLPKDLAAIIAASTAAGYEPQLLKAVDATNRVLRRGMQK
jgi:nucleotide sugar dehydrogenase